MTFMSHIVLIEYLLEGLAFLWDIILINIFPLFIFFVCLFAIFFFCFFFLLKDYAVVLVEVSLLIHF